MGKKYRVDNVTKLDWILKWYRVDNDNNDDDKDYLSNTDVGVQWYYFVNSNNGEIPEDELNYQTNKINNTKPTSTIKWKILVRRLRSDMNDEYHKENIVVVQAVMPNDHSKQDQHNQRKQLKRCESRGMQQIDDLVYYDSNSDDDNE